MRTVIRFTLGGALALVCAALPAQAQDRGTVTYACNIEGMQGMMVAQYERVGNSGIVRTPGPAGIGVIGTGDFTLYYQGQLVTQTARYVLTGEGAYADFTDMGSYDRFRVQFEQQGNLLRMTVNPFGPGPVQYMCELQGVQ